MSKFWQQLLNIWSRLEIAQKATIVLSALGAIALIVILSIGATQPSYQLLARDLNRAKTAEIAAYLEQAGIPYKVVDHDSAILVPSQHIYKLRNDLAQKDMLAEPGKGFELLDKGGFLESTFREHVNYDRAVAGELERSFREIPNVKSARVIIDRPQPSPFVGDDEAKPRASIKLDVTKGFRLSERQVAGVIALTAGAVAGLDHDRIEVMDNTGLLTPKQADTSAAMAQTTLEAEIARETHLTHKAQEQLDTILGPGRGKVKVTVKLDFTKRSTLTVDPTTSKATSEKTSNIDKSTPTVTHGGTAGTALNVENEGKPAAAPLPPATEKNEESQTSYFVGHKNTNTEEEVGVISGMSVSILLPFKEGDVEELDAKNKPTGKKTKQHLPYDKGEKDNFEKLVLNAIGFDSAKEIIAKRENLTNMGTRFSSTVQSMDLYQPPAEAVAQAGSSLPIPGAIADYIGYGVVGIVAIGLLLVARGQLRRSHKAWTDAEAKSRQAEEDAKKKANEPNEANADDTMMNITKNRRNELKANIRKTVLEDPNAATQIVKRWLNEQA